MLNRITLGQGYTEEGYTAELCNKWCDCTLSLKCTFCLNLFVHVGGGLQTADLVPETVLIRPDHES